MYCLCAVHDNDHIKVLKNDHAVTRKVPPKCKCVPDAVTLVTALTFAQTAVTLARANIYLQIGAHVQCNSVPAQNVSAC